jgi:transcriptional regulator with XRE-family HTH domain
MQQSCNSDSVPDTVAQLALQHGLSPARAWRNYLGLTQVEVARRMNISQGVYSRLEARHNLRGASRAKIAAALGITEGQFDF